MNFRRELFKSSDPYAHSETDDVFLLAIKEVLDFHLNHCEAYKKLAEAEGFSLGELESIDDLHKIPAIPTAYLKSHFMLSVPEDQLLMKFTSSGTSGHPSHVGIDLGTGELSLRMMLRLFSYYRLFSARPSNYIVLGYEPSMHNQTGVTKTAHGMTLLTPALHREYALKSTGRDYILNLEGIKNRLLSYAKSPFPVRFMGFPAYFLFMLELLRDEGITLRLHPKSKVFLHGGWKQFYTQKADKSVLYSMSEELLGIPEQNFMDFYGPVEHPIIYADCPHHHFHVPVYARVVVRDPRTLKPVGYGTPGIVNLISPLMGAMPLTSIMPDDLVVMHDGRDCPCGNPAPWFSILGRVGLEEIKTCAANAGDLLKGDAF